ncbi:MAG TPA: hypothetical protein PKY59_15770 [Pyrinomonadaceae bacterium]|nr:hypothetical protein [Pyrinomonadaceae bacterium]
MKKFIFITKEGETLAPNGNPVENLQVIGFVENAESEDVALKQLLQENPWIFDAEFNVAEFEAFEIL